MIAQPQIAHVIRTIPEIGSSTYIQASRFATCMRINDLARLPDAVLDLSPSLSALCLQSFQPVCRILWIQYASVKLARRPSKA
jgi:hypothetical protein